MIYLTNKRGAGPWLYVISEGSGRAFEIDGKSIDVTIKSYRDLVKSGELVKDRWWGIAQHWKDICVGDELFIYTGKDNQGIIGVATIKGVTKHAGGWFVEPSFDLAKCRWLIERPITAPVVRQWKRNLRRNPIDLSTFEDDLVSKLPWELTTPEEVPVGVAYVEGSVEKILVNRYERNRDARNACLKHFGTKCSVCKFDFNEVFGKVASGFIHVHHLIPLAEIGTAYRVDPIEHMRPVCPNCHAILHRGGICWSLKSVIELRRLAGADKGER